MGTNLHILHLADTHIGASLPARPRAGRRYRGMDFVENYRSAVTAGLQIGTDLLLHAGDVFDTPRPHAFAIQAAAAPLLAAAAQGTRVFVVPGNHERSALPDSLLLAHERIHIFRQPGCVQFRAQGIHVCVIGIPNLRRGAREPFLQQLDATGWANARADLNILICHQAFTGAVCGIQNYRFPQHEDNVRPEDIPAGIHYVAAGHIHRHQVMPLPSGDGEIVYSGSIDRVAFVEREESKGVVRLAVDGAGIDRAFVEHDVRPMVVVPLDITGFGKREIRDALDAAVVGLPRAAVAQIRITGQITRGRIAGLNAATRVRGLRPDADVELNFRAVEYSPERVVARAAAVGDSRARRDGVAADGVSRVWDFLPGGSRRVVRAIVGDDRERASSKLITLDQLPTGRANYALFDREGRLLYIGKAKQVRARVRSHLNPKSAKNAFGSWTRAVAFVEVRPAASEFEVAMIEFELIRKQRPPFNRQFREVRSAYYLAVGEREFGQLELTREPRADVTAFGPFGSRMNAELVRDVVNSFWGCAECPDSSRGRRGGVGGRGGRRGAAARMPLLQERSTARLCERYFAGVCCGPCGGRIDDEAYAARVRARDRFLAGVDDGDLVAVEEAFAEWVAGSANGDESLLSDEFKPQARARGAGEVDQEDKGHLQAVVPVADSERRRLPALALGAWALRFASLSDADAVRDWEQTLTYFRHTFDRLRRMRVARSWGGVAFAERRADGRVFCCVPRGDCFSFRELDDADVGIDGSGSADEIRYSQSMSDGVALLAKFVEADDGVVAVGRGGLMGQRDESGVGGGEVRGVYGAARDVVENDTNEVGAVQQMLFS